MGGNGGWVVVRVMFLMASQNYGIGIQCAAAAAILIISEAKPRPRRCRASSFFLRGGERALTGGVRSFDIFGSGDVVPRFAALELLLMRHALEKEVLVCDAAAAITRGSQKEEYSMMWGSKAPSYSSAFR